MGSRLEPPIVARIRLTGYATRELKLGVAGRPHHSISKNGRNRRESLNITPAKLNRRRESVAYFSRETTSALSQ
jgi:hypothetical protein